MSLDIATLGVKVDATGAITGLNTVESKLGRVTKAAAALGITLSAGAIFAKFMRESIASQDAMAQLEARVKSTGMAAGLSAAKLDEMSLALARQTTYGDEAIKGAQSLLLTFTKIKGDTFPAATLAVANLATAMGGDLKGAALQVGKALQDPAQGLLALRRSGVSFSETQQEVIKHLFATGKQAEAQRLILKELEVEFGGAAAAARNTLGGALKALGEEFGNLFEVSRDSSSGIVKFINLINTQIQALVLTFGGQKAIMRAAFSTEAPETLARHLANVEKQMKGIAQQMGRQGFQTATERQQLADLGEEYEVLTGLIRDQAAGKKALGGATETATKATDVHTLADERAARAKEALVAQIKAQVDLEEKLARGVRFDLPKKLPMQAAGIGSGPDFTIADAAKKVQEQVTRTTLAESAKRAVGEVAAWFKANKDMEQIRENFLRGMQESFARTFEDIFTKGIKSFGDLFRSLGDLIKKAAAQMAASGLMDFLSGAYNKGKGEKSGIGGIVSGIAGVASAIPGVGWIAGAVAGIAGLFQSHHKAAEAAKRQSEENARLTIEHRKAAEAARVLAEAEKKRSEEKAVWDSARAMDELKARDLRAQGLDDEAEAQELWNRHYREAMAAQKEFEDGKLTMEYLQALNKTQEAERDRLAATQAAAKAARDAAKAEQDLADARAKAVAFQDLEVEMLQAKGQTAEAEQMAFDLEQRRRLEEAMKNQTAEYVEKLKELQALQRANRAAALAGGGAAAVEAQSTASNVFAGADTVTASFGTKVSAEVGDRMLDNLVSIRVILRAIEANTRNLGGKINTSLGLSLADNYALAGSSVLS